ncbi:MAG TPA: STAS domain-containing protein [Mycobacteriales bacterium]|nr:STAS domain-containing protein [Mycobacteriales bacterium]
MDLVLTTHTVLRLRGEVDLFTAPRLRATLCELVESGRSELIVDMGDVEYFGTAGIAALAGALAHVRRHGGWLKVACPHPHVLKLFQLTDMNKVFRIYPTVTEAIADCLAPVLG